MIPLNSSPDTVHSPLIENSSATFSKINCCFHFLTGTSAVIGVTISSIFLKNVLTEFTKDCEDVLNSFSPAFIDCRSKYLPAILSYELILSISSIALGYLIQKGWEIRTTEAPSTQADLEALSRPTRTKRFTSNIRQKIASIQREYSYEFTLAVGYLFNGLWINTHSQKTWYDYFSCQAAAIGITSFAFGMFARVQQKNIKRAYTIHFPSEKGKNWQLLLPGLGGTALFTSSFFFPTHTSAKTTETVRGIALMLFARPFGNLSSRFWESLKVSEPSTYLQKGKNAMATLHFCRSIFLLAGYSLYLRSQGNDKAHYVTRLLGTSLVGFTCGIQQNYFSPFPYKIELVEEQEEISLREKIRTMVRNHWKATAFFATSTILLAADLLPCFTTKMIICPFSFEFSGNYVNLDGKGMAIGIYAGLAGFYIRKICKKMYMIPTEGTLLDSLPSYRWWIRKFGGFALEFTDRHHYDLIALLPYATFRSGDYIPAYNSYSSYDPLFVLLLLGFSMGMYKEQVKSKTGVQTSPGFVNVGMLVNPF